MRIEGFIGPEYSNLPGGKTSSSKSKAGHSGSMGQTDGAKLVSAHESLIQAAVAAEEVNVRAVEEARAMLESGQLDTPEAARRVAESLVDLGL